MNFPAGRTNIMQGGYQIAGLGLSAVIGIFAGIIVGIILKLINHHEAKDQFRDA
jgi:tetrahydromethanopterin S-methyltransferase subunit G